MLDELVAQTLNEMQELYLADSTPWVIGFSGGKDSSTVVQLTYRMLLNLPPEARQKTVHVIASDTLVESPVVERFLEETLRCIRAGAAQHGIPMVVEKVMPELTETFWVSLLGKGYPSPNRFFRWCTERLKIDPATRYIQGRIDEYGSVIILLGARKEESASRAQVLENHRVRGSLLRKHATMPQASVYTPIAEWTTEHVWPFLLTWPTPWDSTNRSNKLLRDLYKDAAGECPLVIDTSTPSCGQSRFGCWTCTVITNDNSMKGFVESGREEYEWMASLMDYRDKLKRYRDMPEKRERWRKTDPTRPRGWAVELGQVHIVPGGEEEQEDQLGPFTLETRKELLEDLLILQDEVFRKTGTRLIQEEEIKLIRLCWTEDYRFNEVDMLDILERVHGQAFRGDQIREERKILEVVCDENRVDVLAIDRLVDLERGYATKLRKRGMNQAIETLISELVIKEGSGKC